MGWIKIVGKTLEYVGKLAQAEGFEEWAETQGIALIEKIASEKGFSLLGKKRAAKKELWEELKEAVTSNALRDEINDEAKVYQLCLARIANEVKSLPKSNGSNPVIAVPRVILNDAALMMVSHRLRNSDELNKLKGGDKQKEYFFNQLIRELDKALISARPSPKKPFPSEGDWLIVGFDRNFNWLSKDWLGHYYLYKPFQRGKLDHKKVEKVLRGLSAFLGRMSADEKNKILQGTPVISCE
jgi:hypothetical protein